MMKGLTTLTIVTIWLLAASAGPVFSETTAYVPNFDNDEVVRIPVSDTADTTSVAVCDGPYGAAVSPNGADLVVTCATAGSVTIIPTNSFTDTGSHVDIDLGEDGVQPRGVAIESRGRFAYVADFGTDRVWEIDINSSTGVTSRNFDVGAGPWGVAAFYDDTDAVTRVYVANHEDDSISVISDGEVEAAPITAVGDGPIGVALSPDGDLLYVANNLGNTVAVIDTGDKTKIADISVDAGPWAVAIASDGDIIFVTHNQANTVSVIDTRTRTVSTTALVDNEPTGVAAPIFGDFAYVVSQAENSILKVDTDGAVTTISTNLLSGAFSLGAFIGGPGPQSPSDLNATTVSSSRIELSWTDNDDDTLGFRIERRDDEQEAFARVATVDVADTTYVDDGLARGTMYHYRIRAFNETAESTFSGEASATTRNERFTWCFIRSLP